jgi:hypothetical protein
MRRTLFALLLLLSALAQAQPVPTSTTPQAPVSALNAQLDVAMAIIVALMAALIALAAAVYAIGTLFGSETQARASTWAKSMLTAVGVAALLLFMLFFFLPNYQLSGSFNLDDMISKLMGTASTAFSVLIIVLVVLSAAAYALGQLSGTETRARATVWATGLLAAALLCAVIYILVFVVFTQFGDTVLAGTVLEPYKKIVINIAFFVAAIILITYLASRVFGNAEWEAYLNVELSNLAGSFLVLVFVLGFFAAGSAFSAMVTSSGSPPVAALTFMRETIASNMLTGVYDIFRIQTCTSMLSTFSRRLGEAVLTNVVKVFPGVDVFVQITNVLGYGMVSIYSSVSAQMTMLNLVDALMVPFVLPAGLILRFFPPTRDAGSFLIALAFAFQFVFPMLYLINGMVLSDLQVPVYDKARSELIIQSLCGPFKFGVAGVLFQPLTSAATSIPIFGSLPGVSGALRAVLSEPTLNLLPMAEFVPIMRSLALLSLFGLFVPAFALTMTIASINAMTKFLTAKV